MCQSRFRLPSVANERLSFDTVVPLLHLVVAVTLADPM